VVNIDKALDKVVDWVVTTAKKLFAKAFGKDKKDERTDEQKSADLTKGVAEAEALLMDESISATDVRAQLPGIQTKYRLTRLALVTDSKAGDDGRVVIHVRLPSLFL